MDMHVSLRRKRFVVQPHVRTPLCNVLSYMDNVKFTALAGAAITSGMLCAGRVVNIVHYLLQTSVLRGEVVEFGCYTGKTAALMSFVSAKPVWLYDSFQGLPDRTSADAGAEPYFLKGSLACSVDEVMAYFMSHNLLQPRIYAGWFNEIRVDDLPELIRFAHIDGDFFESIRDSLEHVYPRMVRGSVCIIDDYSWGGLPGVKQAADDFLRDKREKISVMITHGNSHHGVFVKA